MTRAVDKTKIVAPIVDKSASAAKIKKAEEAARARAAKKSRPAPVDTPLGDRAAAFCREYMVDMNATQAAIRAGYSPKTAGVQASRLLKNVKIIECLNVLKAERVKRTEIDADYVLTTIQDTIERCRQAKPAMTAMDEPIFVENPEGQMVPMCEFQPVAVLKGCELLGKHLKMFTEKHEHSGPGGGAIRINKELTAEELKAEMERRGLPQNILDE